MSPFGSHVRRRMQQNILTFNLQREGVPTANEWASRINRADNTTV